jgi:hypothetical protein
MTGTRPSHACEVGDSQLSRSLFLFLGRTFTNHWLLVQTFPCAVRRGIRDIPRLEAAASAAFSFPPLSWTLDFEIFLDPDTFPCTFIQEPSQFV